MLKKKVPEEEKPKIVLETEVVEEKPVETPPASVSQLAAVVEPEKVTQPEMPAVHDVPEMPEKKARSFWPVWVALAFVLGAGAGFGLSRINFENKPMEVAAEPTASPTAAPTQAPEKTFDRSIIKVKVLNGSGVRGAAGVKKEELEKLGYKDVQTGNADRDDYVMSEISIKASMESFVTELEKDMAAKKTATLAADDTFDVLLIIGSK